MLRRIAILTVLTTFSAFAIACGGGGGPLNALMNEVRLDDPRANRTYAESQAAIEVPESVPALIEFLANDESPKVRAWSALILGRIGDPQAVEALTAALSDTDSDTRNRAPRISFSSISSEMPSTACRVCPGPI